MARPRWILRVQAQVWRALMAIGMFVHRLAAPWPPSPSFSRLIPTTISTRPGFVKIQFYVPKDYYFQRSRREKRFPLVVNFHGGGFTLGTATDDARWAKVVVDEIDAVFVSVNYRLAPEYPFPTAVEDGVDALLYLIKEADELFIDTKKIAISGFSAGGNMAFTVPLRLQKELEAEENVEHVASSIGRNGKVLIREVEQIKPVAIVSWYPSTDYTLTRMQRSATNGRKDQNVPAILTDLFDESYLHPQNLDKKDPYLSPGQAPDDMLLHALPDSIILYTCEFDMLRAEADNLRLRLEHLGKSVFYQCIPGVRHAWDKAPNPIRWTPGVYEIYIDACTHLRNVFDQRSLSENESRRQ